MHLLAAGLSDIGRQRELNEDRLLLVRDFSLFLVADGMGGHRAGHIASTLAIETIARFYETTKNEDITWPVPLDPTKTEDENRLVTAIKLANRSIFSQSMNSREYYGMGTTIVSACYSDIRNELYIAHVGDSRCYRIRNATIEQLTHDHSWANYLQSIPDIQGFSHEFVPKNVITRALGIQEQVEVDCQVDIPRPKDRYLLCSDGLSGMVSDDELFNIISSSESNALQQVVQTLIDRANASGGEDNITAIVLQFSEEPAS